MNKLFLEILNMSITAGYCVLAVVLIRLLLKKFPKIYSYVLWAVVFFRLVCPVSIKSVFSLLRFNTNVVSESLGKQGTAGLNNNTISDVINNAQSTAGLNAGGTSDVVQGAAGLNTGNGISDTINNVANNTNVAGDTVNQTVSDVTSNTGSIEAGSSLLESIITVATIVWLVVALGLIVYSVISAVRLKKKLKNAVHIEANIYEVADLSTPFVFGFIKPGIYLPASLAEPERSFVLKHELTHLRRKDYIIKQAAFFIVCVHWFNPLAWLAFYLMSKDMEMSCDESVIAKLSKAEKADYSETLLSLATDKRVVGMSPLAFGEGNVKDRIKNVLNYKKPMLWVSVVIVAVLAVVLVGLAVNPEDKEVGGESLEVESSSEAETLKNESLSQAETLETENTSKTETINVSEIDAENDPVEVIEAYVEYMGNDLDKLVNLFPSDDIEDNIRFLNNQDNIDLNIGILNVNDAELLEVVEIDLKYVDQFLNGNYENEIVRTFVACIDYSTNENNWYYANGIEYDAIPLILDDNLWKIAESERITNVKALVNAGYELSEEHVDAAIEKQRWMLDGFEAGDHLKKYRGDAVMYYDAEESIVDGHKLEPINDGNYDINNLIKVSYYEQSDVSLYCYEVKRGSSNNEYMGYNLVLEYDGVYQVLDSDYNIGFDVMFGYNSGLDDVYNRAFDKGYEMDYDGDKDLELVQIIMQTNGSGGYDVDALVVFDFNAETGLYDCFFVLEEDFYDMKENAVKAFIDEYYGDYTIDDYDDYVFEDGYKIMVGTDMNMYKNDDGSYAAVSTVWGRTLTVESPTNEIGMVSLNIRYIGNGQFAAKANRYTQWS